MGNDRSGISEFEKLEFQRLSTEIQNDRSLQFNLFWQSITVTALIISFCATVFKPDIWMKFPFIIFAPHLILIPTSSIILNRARTANRKSGYLLSAYDKYTHHFNWERDLTFLRQSDTTGGQLNSIAPHRATTIRDMLFTITAFEVICFMIFTFFLFAQPLKTDDLFQLATIAGGLIYSMIYSMLISNRGRAYFCTRYHDSIQGYASQWIVLLGLNKRPMWKIDFWNEERWHVTLKKELTSGVCQFLWKAIWNFQKRETLLTTLSPSYVKPALLGGAIWILIALFIKSSNINIPTT